MTDSDMIHKMRTILLALALLRDWRYDFTEAETAELEDILVRLRSMKCQK